ncbi:MAG: hypothetical protein VB138_05855 [Burkholderia sp.]
MTENVDTVEAFKGFDKDLKCRSFEYAVGGTFNHVGKVAACKEGFHACEYPLDVFNYYAPASSRFALVEMSGEISRDGSDSKIAAARLTVKAELKIPDLVSRTIALILSKIDPTKTQTTTGYQSAASNTGDYSAASNTGYQSAARVSGQGSVAMSIGALGKAKACAGSAIVLAYRADDGSLICVRTAIAGGDVKPDMWYSLNANGDFVEVAAS